MPEPLPATIGKYQVQASLGEGGFGRVFKAFDPTVGRLVAVKVLTAQGGPGLLARFQNEASAAGNLHHENIVTIYEFGEFNGSPFIAMEYLEGNDLNVLMYGKRNLTLLDKVRIMTQVGEGIGCAHDNGVIHRDIKPANIKILTNGSVKIMDFGIARLTRDDSTRLTNKGDILGTIRYMCCDQFKGMEADVLSDIFAFGVVFYELVAGVHPFEGADAGAFMYKITTLDPAPLSEVVPGCPRTLNYIVLKALEKERDLRYQSLEDLLLDMRPLLFELQRGRAAELVAQARTLFDSGQVAKAQVCMREAIDLDPSNPQAGELREQIQQSAQRRTLQPKVDALLKNAENDLSGNLYHQAIESLEAAARLDPTNPSINTKIKAVRQQLDITRQRLERLRAEKAAVQQTLKASRFVDALPKLEALCAEFPEDADFRAWLAGTRNQVWTLRRAQDIRHAGEEAARLVLTARFAEADEVLRRLAGSYPDDTDIIRMQQQAARARDEYARRQKVAQAIQQAEKSSAAQRFEEGRAALETILREFPQDSGLLEAKSALELQWAIFRRAQRVEKAVSSARFHLAEGKHQSAADILRQAAADDPENSEVAELLGEVQRRMELDRRSLVIDQVCGQARQLAESGQFDPALEALREPLGTYPDDPRLKELASSIADRKGLEVTRSCTQLLREKRFPEAVLALTTELKRQPGDPELVKLRDQARAEWEASKRAEALSRAVGDIRAALLKHRPEEARALAERYHAEFGTDREFIAARGQVEEACRSAEHNKQLLEALKAIGALEAERNWPAALHACQAAEAKWPDAPGLAGCSARIQQEMARAPRETEVGRLARLVRQSIEAKDWNAATLGIEELARQFPGDPSLPQLRESFQAERLKAESDQELAEVEKAIDRRDWPAATRCLAALFLSPDSPRLSGLRERVTQGKARDQALLDAKAALRKGHLDEAHKLLKPIAARDPADSEVAAALAEAQGRRGAVEAEKAIAQGRTRAGQLAGQGQFDAAIQLLRELLELYGRQSGLDADLEEAIAAKRQSDVARLVGAARQAIKAEAWKIAAQWLDELARQYPNEPQLPALREDLQAQRPRVELEQARIDQGKARDQSLADAEAALRQAERAAGQDERDRMAAAVRQAIEQKDGQAAAQRLDELTRRFPGDPKLGALRESVKAELRRGWIEEAVAGAEKAIARGDWPAAEKCLTLDPNSSRAKELRARIASGKAREQALIDAKAALAKGLFDDAEKLLQPLLATNPSDAPAAAVLQETQARRAAAPAERARLVALVRQSIGQNNWKAASQQLDELGRRFPDEPSLAALSEALQRMYRQVENEGLVGAEEAVGRGDWPAAETFLGAVPDSPRRRDLGARIASGRAREQTLIEARTALGNGLFEEAESLLQALISRDGPDAAASVMLHAAQAARAKAEEEAAGGRKTFLPRLWRKR